MYVICICFKILRHYILSWLDVTHYSSFKATDTFGGLLEWYLSLARINKAHHPLACQNGSVSIRCLNKSGVGGPSFFWWFPRPFKFIFTHNRARFFLETLAFEKKCPAELKKRGLVVWGRPPYITMNQMHNSNVMKSVNWSELELAQVKIFC